MYNAEPWVRWMHSMYTEPLGLSTPSSRSAPHLDHPVISQDGTTYSRCSMLPISSILLAVDSFVVNLRLPQTLNIPLLHLGMHTIMIIMNTLEVL